MTCQQIPGGILCLGGPVQEIEAGGRWLFEWHPWCGPTVLDRRNLSPRANQPNESGMFWQAVEWWDKQGRRMKDGLCVWNRELPVKYKTFDVGRLSVILDIELGERCELASVPKNPPSVPVTPPGGPRAGG